MIALIVSDDKICSANIKQFWVEHFPTERKLLSVVTLAFFAKKSKSTGISG